MFEPLILESAPPSLWLDFQAERRLPARAGAIVDHWQRCKALGAHHDGPRPEDALDRGADFKERVERLGPLLACGSEVLERASESASEHHYTLLVADPSGVIVHGVGGGDFADFARRVRLMEGAHWDEQLRGTNAIGTAIAEERPVFVTGGAHFARPYQELVCYAAPIRGADGAIEAILDVTSSLAHADPRMGFDAIATARALEELLRLHVYSMAGATVTRALARSLERMSCPVAIIEPPGRVSRVNAPARELFGGASTAELSCLLGVDFADLSRLAESGDAAEVWVGGRSLRLHAEPIESGGKVIALVTFFERGVGRVAPAPAPPEPQALFADFFAVDAATVKALHWAGRVAASDIPIMLLAETGAGKELVARGIHRASARAEGPFIAVNCGAIAPSLLESELFGHAGGAFTGAEARGRDGLLASASGGTLFLDEVAEMPLAMQVALLRVLENGTYYRLGDARPRRADVRVVCATGKNLTAMVAAGSFRNDLYFRLKGAIVNLPPLRARTDVVALAHHLLIDIAARRELVPTPGMSDALEAFVAGYGWPGNVRELEATLEVAVVLAGSGRELDVEHLPPDMQPSADLPAADLPAAESLATESLANAQRQTIRRVLTEVAGNVSLAAKRLGIARSTLYRKMRRHGLRLDDE